MGNTGPEVEPRVAPGSAVSGWKWWVGDIGYRAEVEDYKCNILVLFWFGRRVQ